MQTNEPLDGYLDSLDDAYEERKNEGYDATQSYLHYVETKQMMDALNKAKEELAQKEARIRELEETLSKIIQMYPINSLGITVDDRMRMTARETLLDKEE